jgi:hypothetical protein
VSQNPHWRTECPVRDELRFFSSTLISHDARSLPQGNSSRRIFENPAIFVQFLSLFFMVGSMEAIREVSSVAARFGPPAVFLT